MGCKYSSTQRSFRNGIRFRKTRALSQCGMRHPTNGQNDDDLSRLTASSSSSSSTSSTASTPSHDNICPKGLNILPSITKNNSENSLRSNHQQQQHQKSQPKDFQSTYLPEIIDPLEWQKSRKRKDRQDVTSTTQDRKLVRSNSEELITNVDYEVIRRVASHEDFKKQPLHEINSQQYDQLKVLKTIEENESRPVESNAELSDNVKTRTDNSPGRGAHRVSPHRDYRYHHSRYKENDELDSEHDRRRAAERFSRTRAPTGRRSSNTKKPSKQMASKLRERDENVYKYDISALKHERRGFVSKLRLEDRGRKEEAADGEQIKRNDVNDNNLIDFHLSRSDGKDISEYECEQSTRTKKSFISEIETTAPAVLSSPKFPSIQADSLPWVYSIQEEQTPVLSRRFAAFDQTDFHEDDDVSAISPVTVTNERMSSMHSFGGAFANMENLKTREILTSGTATSLPMGLFQSPDERLRHINKKLVALKRRVAQLEENLERTYGYRPSQSERFNDKQIKSVMAEIVKLRKEKHQLKTDPVAALGLKVSGGMDSEKKLSQMKDTLIEIERKLIEKRIEAKRPQNLEALTPDQLVQEKTAVQHGLLYLESLYGRPSIREERDAARPLYDRYRTIKRMVTRSISMAGALTGIQELPTILEHEALSTTIIESPQSQSIISTDTTSSSPDSGPHQAHFGHFYIGGDYDASADATPLESPNDIPSVSSSVMEDSSSENVHTLSLDELWEHLEKIRDDKRELKKTIKEFEALFEEQNGRKMLKQDRKAIEDTYAIYKQKKAKVRLLQALIKKKMDN